MKPDVLASWADYNRDWYYNPHATNRFSEACRRRMLDAERRLLRTLDIPETQAQVIWTSGGTEANNLGCLGTLTGVSRPVALVSATAHPSVLEPCRRAEHLGGASIEMPVHPDGSLDLDRVPEDAAADARLCAVLHVNNETGVIHDLIRLRGWLDRRAPRARLVVDAAQSCGKLRIPWREARIDALAIAGRKIGGPPSTGALILRRRVPLQPLLYGGGQQHGLRPGTVDVPGVLAFVDAVEAATARRAGEEARVRSLSTIFRKRLRERLGERIRFVTPPDASPWILMFLIRGCEGAVVMRLLAERGIVVGTGSACSAESRKASHVLTSMGVPPRDARGAVRVSFGWNTDEEQVRRSATELGDVVEHY